MIGFDDILGQRPAIEWLRRAYAAGRLPHGLIFAGPCGVGKATTAGALAALFLCEQPHETCACGQCPSCRALDAGTHPDHHVVTRDLIRYHDRTGKSKGIDLSIHVLRPEVIEPAGRKPVMGRGKVFILEQAELMNAQAQNALLKTLEEPAGRTLIVLLTDRPDAMLPTIRSRCPIVRFAALDRQAVQQKLAAQGVAATVASEAAELTGGSLGVAGRWIEDGVVGPARELAQQVDGALVGHPPADLAGWLRSAADAYAACQLQRDPLSSKDQATREGLAIYLMVAAERARARLVQADDPAQRERACAAIDAIVRAESYLDANVNTALTLQQLALALSDG